LNKYGIDKSNYNSYARRGWFNNWTILTKKEREKKWFLKNSKIFQEKLQEAKDQIKRYEQTEEVKSLQMLKKIVVISCWLESEIMEVE